MFQKATVLIFLLVGLTLLLSSCQKPQVCREKAPQVSQAHKDWDIAIQAWTFNRYTFYEAVDKTASLGLSHIEAYSGQKLSDKKPNIKFGPDMSPAIRKEVKQKLANAGIKLINFGVVKLTNDETQCREVFDFAKDMGIETVVSEPPEEAFDMLDRLCKEYKIKLAVHNHPKPSHYWNPDTVLKVCKGRSKWIGACGDTGHWVRSGLDPVKCLKKLDGRIISLHFKEIDDGHDVVWGTGKGKAKPLLEELDRQGFEGVFSIEYEYNWENSVPEIQKCIAYFNEVAAKF